MPTGRGNSPEMVMTHYSQLCDVRLALIRFGLAAPHCAGLPQRRPRPWAMCPELGGVAAALSADRALARGGLGSGGHLSEIKST